MIRILNLMLRTRNLCGQANEATDASSESATPMANCRSMSAEMLDGADDARSLTFWHRLITLIVSVLEDDRKHYAPVLNQ